MIVVNTRPKSAQLNISTSTHTNISTNLSANYSDVKSFWATALFGRYNANVRIYYEAENSLSIELDDFFNERLKLVE
jgi:hypothetical protein